jgi:FtsZ-binding cell division protein ZapB
MTDEERQKLCEALRGKRPWPGALAKMMPDAADEIDRLVTENKKLREQRGAWEQTTRTALAQSNRRGK